MNEMNKTKINQITKILVDMLFYLGIIAVLAVPFLAKYLGSFYDYGSPATIIFTVILYASGICALYILFNLKQMFKTLLGGNPFVDKNIICFKRMAAACGVISLIYIVKCFLLFSWGTIVVAVMFVVAALFCLTLRNIFEQAISYKLENDLTV